MTVRKLRPVAGEPIALSIAEGVSFDRATPSGKWIHRPPPAAATCSPASARAASLPPRRRRAGRRHQQLEAVRSAAARRGEGIGGGELRPFRPGADDDRHVEAELAREDLLERRLERRVAAGGLEDDVAALDVGGDVGPAELAAKLAQRRHRQLAPPDIDRPQQRQPVPHARQLSRKGASVLLLLALTGRTCPSQ